MIDVGQSYSWQPERRGGRISGTTGSLEHRQPPWPALSVAPVIRTSLPGFCLLCRTLTSHFRDLEKT